MAGKHIHNVDNGKVQRFCARWRKDILGITLKEMSQMVDVTMGTLNAFEKGRSNNLSHIFLYYGLCTNDKDKQIFINTLFVAIYEMNKDVIFSTKRDTFGNLLEYDIIITDDSSNV